MKDKILKMESKEVQPLISNLGYCYATNEITVEGKKVGYMYREELDDENDSGWRFFSGAESQEYINNPENIGIFDVNTIANYDSSILPHLHSPIGQSLEKVVGSNSFRVI